MSDNKKYYYLKLKENFFNSDELMALESMPDGYMYSNILLKLYLRGLKNNGKLMVNERIPYNSKMLSDVTRHPVAVVEKAIQTFASLGLIEILENGAIYLLDIQNFIGESSTEADRKRLYRSKIESEKKLLTGQMSGQNNVDCPDKNPPEIRDKSIDISTTTTSASVTEIYRSYSDNIHPISGQIEADRLAELTEKHGGTWVLDAIQRAVIRNKRSLGYIEGILKGWDTNGFDDGEASKNGQRSAGNHKPYHAKGKKSETDWSKETGGW
ncbi:MAG: phage replisome organizer N-terminal domain-containing protein [Selenomonadaceae bacterium]